MLKVRGYAAVFGNLDHHNEVIDRHAFSGWLESNEKTDVPIFWQHAHQRDGLAAPIGVTTTIKQDRKGLYFEGTILDTPAGLEAQELIKGGAVRNASFGFKTIDEYLKKEILHKSALELKEISPVNWGANDKAYVEADPDQSGMGETDGD